MNKLLKKSIFDGNYKIKSKRQYYNTNFEMFKFIRIRNFVYLLKKKKKKSSIYRKYNLFPTACVCMYICIYAYTFVYLLFMICICKAGVHDCVFISAIQIRIVVTNFLTVIYSVVNLWKVFTSHFIHVYTLASNY